MPNNKNRKSGKEYFKRYLLFLIGIFINSYGISFVTKANLGTSPISSIPYVLSLTYTPTLGMFTLYFSIILILFQILILKKDFPKQYLLQIPVCFLFSYFIDLSMNILSFIHPETYLIKIVFLLIGCFILGVGVFIEMIADVVMLPGEAFVKAFSSRFKTDFGKTKVCFDSTMTIGAAILGFVLTNKIMGVREGTVVAAILVGSIARRLKRKIGFIEKYLTDVSKEVSSTEVSFNSNKFIVTISREFGSCGRQIGEKLAKEMGFSFYDHNIIEMISEKSKLSEQFIETHEQKMSKSLLYDLSSFITMDEQEETPEDKLYNEEVDLITNLSEKENCVIVGRCADYILRNNRNCCNVFLYADEEYKVKEIMMRQNISIESAKIHIKDINEKRFHHYRYYTGGIWGLSQNYDLCINVSDLGIDNTVKLIRDYLKTNRKII